MGLLAIITFAHIAPEGGINFLIYAMGYLAATIFFAAVTITYLMPIIGDDWPQPENSSLPHQTACRPRHHGRPRLNSLNIPSDADANISESMTLNNGVPDRADGVGVIIVGRERVRVQVSDHSDDAAQLTIEEADICAYLQVNPAAAGPDKEMNARCRERSASI
jgi:hypothetical protein